MNHHIQIYTTTDGQASLHVSLDGDTVWLTQAQMALLFDTSSDNISLHLKNIYAEQELMEEATVEDFSVVRQEGSRQVKRRLKHYNLDAIISVGYRVSSARATQPSNPQTLTYHINKPFPRFAGFRCCSTQPAIINA